MRPDFVTTNFELTGYKTLKNVGLVRGIVVRSRSIVGSFFGALQTIFGGNITIYTNMCERARTDAYQLMCQQAERNGANAVVMVRYDTTEILPGVTEVLCYGTAIVVEDKEQ